MMSEVRSCKHCQGTLQGRSDQIFCSNYCRSIFHNKQKRQEFQTVRAVNHQLRINRTILARLANLKILECNLRDPRLIGFSPTTCTSSLPNDWQGCYEYAFKVQNGKLTIAQHRFAGDHPAKSRFGFV